MNTITTPLLTLLDREKSIVEAKPIIDKYSPYLKELVNFSTNLFARCQESINDKEGTHLSLFFLYYHVIQMADGIEGLISNSCFAATVPLLRSLMEATISIVYILEDDYNNRSSAWLVRHYLDRKRYLESFVPSSKRGREFKNRIKKDEIAQEIGLDTFFSEQHREDIKVIKDVLNRPKFIEIRKLFESKKLNKWYHINGGPQSFEQLANSLNRQLEYEIHYRYFSSVIHANDATRILEKVNDISIFVPMRSIIFNSEDLCITAGYLLIEATLKMSSKFRPEEEVLKQIQQIVRQHRPEALKI